MILAIEGVDRHAYPYLFEQMFRMRTAVFSERLGWDVTVVDGKRSTVLTRKTPSTCFASTH
jgi:acyl homoserine lactone synthase